MLVTNNFQLKQFNTFGIAAVAKHFAGFSSVEALCELLDRFPSERKLFLGGGSNILFLQDYDGIVLKNNLKGISIAAQDQDHIYVKAKAGESWHELVTFCVDRNFGGIENLSLIPGNAGAAPMQNIGAYGVELADVFHELTAYDTIERKTVTFNSPDCAFGYRDSVFKKLYKNRFVILDITLRLDKKPVFNLTYKGLKQELDKYSAEDITIQLISSTVIRIRRSKLPDPSQIGNAGSFFKNPEIPGDQFQELRLSNPDIAAYKLDNGNYKVAAAWLIEQCGFKGFRRGDAGCHINQPLVLVNYGNASGKEIYDLSEDILQRVSVKFAIVLEREVNIV